MIQFLTRTGTLTGVMPRIYISCHHDDFDLHFRTICADIFAVQENCAIFYEEDPSEDYSEDVLQEILGEMRLIAVPVTRRLLTESSRALDTEIPFAVRKNIPVLPVLVEEDDMDNLMESFNSIQVFSGLQFLNRYDKDRTALRYEDKLAIFLKSILISEDKVQKINDEFSAKIFLSYRKKDRASAQELMRKIHGVDICRDTAIWYDEYLIPGESFDSNIVQALDESDVFVMSVSQAFEEPGNYVADHEYPDAVRKNKPLIAARMKHFDQDSLDILEVLYPGINTLMVDPGDRDRLGVTLRRRLTDDAGISEDKLLNNDGEHLYYIALAYKNGIRTEADPVRAADLFAMSADNGCYESYLSLIRMYRIGDGVSKDNDTALLYCEKALCRLRPLEGSSLRSDNVLASIYEEKGHIHSRLLHKEETLAAYCSAYDLRRKMQKMYEDASILEYGESMIAVSSIFFTEGMFADARDLAVRFISENELVMDGGGESGRETEDLALLRIRVRICTLMCAIYIQLRQHSEVLRYIKSKVIACEQIEAATGAAEDLRELAEGYLGYADYLKIHDLKVSDEYIEKYSKIRSRLAEYDRDRPATISDAIDTFSIADNALMRINVGDMTAPERAAALYNEVLDICSGLMDGSNRFNALLLTAKVYTRFGDMERAIKGSRQKTLDCFRKALDICRDAEKEYRNNLQILHVTSGLLDRIGAICLEINDLTSATQYYTDALEIDMRTSRITRDPASRHNLAKSYMRCAEISKSRGHQPVTDVNNRSALKILESLIQQTEDYRISEDLALVNFRLGMSERFTAEQRLGYYNKASHVYGYLMSITNNASEYVRAYESVQECIKDIS